MATPINPIALARTAAQQYGRFVLVNLCAGGSFVFDYFPSPSLDLSRRANWHEQDTTIGTRPLFYFNREPRVTDVREVWLDRTDTNESITPQIEALLALQDEVCEGTPPPLLAIWGDRQERVVLEEVRVEEHKHHPTGYPIRARVSLTLKEVQDDA
jgi:phage protein U